MRCWIHVLLSLLALTAQAGSYTYWQVTVTADSMVLNPEQLTVVERDVPPTPDVPITVTPKVVAGAKEYHILRVPTETPFVPRVKVENAGNDTFYYWLVGHAGPLRSPMAGPAVAKECNAVNPKNVITWEPIPAYDSYTILRTTTPEPPAGVQHALLVWGVKGDTLTDTNGQILADYPCYPQGTGSGKPPVGTGAFLVGVSKGEAVTDTGSLKTTTVAPTRTLLEKSRNQFTSRNPSRGALSLAITNDQPTEKYSWGGPVGLNIDVTDYAGGHNDYWMGSGGPHTKSFHIPFWIWQHNYTFGQVANQVIYSEKHGEGDNVLLTLHNTTEGLTEDGGDEGTEIIMSSSNRAVKTYDYILKDDVPLFGTRLPCTTKCLRSGAGRVVVNLSQARRDGVITRIDDDMKLNPALSDRVQSNRVTRLTGEGTNWTADMAGWYISLECDTRPDGVRQWYRVIRVNSPNSLDIYAYTFFSTSTYLGHAANVVRHGVAFRGGVKHEPRPNPDPASAKDGREAYTIAPATTVADPSLLGSDLAVMPLKQPWKAGEKIQVVAGPQTTVSIGKMSIQGQAMPQDFLYGLWVYNWTDRLSNDGALVIQGRWNKGVEVMLDNAGLSSAFVAYGKADPQGAAFVAPADTNGLRFDGTPVVLSGASATSEVVFSENTHDGKKLLAVSPTAVMLGDGVALRGNALIRGRETFSCDGKAAVFTVRFPRPYPDAPYVVASSNLPIGMGVTGVTVNNFTVTFATPPPAGEKNLTITWIVTQ